jgi:hypothetical protein
MAARAEVRQASINQKEKEMLWISRHPSIFSGVPAIP